MKSSGNQAHNSNDQIGDNVSNNSSSNPSQAQPTGKLRANYILYEQLLVGCFDKIRKTVPRKCKELRDLCGDAIDQVKADADDEILSANKYFRVMKLALDTKIPRLTEHILYHVQKLVAHGLMDGNHPDDCLYTDEERPKSNGTLPRKLIDAIVDEVCKCTAERDQQVQLQVVRALLTIVATSTTEVHERSLLKVMSSLYYIHIASTNPVNQNTAKASLIQMISIVFKKMEQHAGEFAESIKKLNPAASLSQLVTGTGSLSSVVSAGDSQREGAAASKSARQKRNMSQMEVNQASSRGSGQRGNAEMPGVAPTGEPEDPAKLADTGAGNSIENTLITFTPEEQYAQVTLTYVIDNVCLHAAKVEEAENFYKKQIGQLMESDEEGKEAAAEQLRLQMEDEVKAIPLLAVPRSSKGRKKVEGGADGEKTAGQGQTKKAGDKERQVQLANEQGLPNGKFGWCISCRAAANLYCKHTRHPVCSFECKQRHIRLLEEALASHEEAPTAVATPRVSQASGPSAVDEPHARDALLVFNKLCQLLQSKDLDRKLDNVYDVRKVLLGLDLIHSCLENPGQTFVHRREFVNAIRDSLCSALLKFAVSSEQKIFSRTVSIFHLLFLHFREHLKQTIGVFIDNFFLRMLDSGNSEYDCKYSILDFFDRLSENAEHILEIFANYDCDIGQKDICVRIIDSLSSIAQGKFQKSDHNSLLTNQQMTSLRRQALEILVKILHNLNRTIETAVKLEALAQARLAESKQERANLIGELQARNEADQNASGDVAGLQQHQPGDEQVAATESMDAKQQMQNRVFKSEMSKAAGKFNLKPKNGLKYLQEKGYLVQEPRELQIKQICRFLKETPALSATKIGEYLGDADQFNQDVLSCYIDELDFTHPNIEFVDALKILLNGFRIPGEGQQIDRVMEKFGEKLSRDRPEDFGNAEGVYLLAYATLMLQTSLHNPQAQKLKMKLADFKKITQGVKLSDTKEIDFDKFREELFHRVEREPFTLEEDEDARLKLESGQHANKKLLFDKEREGILRRGATMLKQTERNNKFVLIKDISTIRPLFENTWSANLAVFSVVLDETEDQNIADLCLQGFIHAIRISGHYEIHEVRNAFVSSLSKFTQVSASREIKQKNINCIRELLNLAIHDGECLRDSWYYVLDCLSKIDQMRVLGLGDLPDSEYFQSEAVSQIQGQPTNQQVLMRNCQIIADEIDANQIELIFLQSERLNPNAIIDFIENLCKVSRDELSEEDSPKKFCLQKLVEVASLNMNRVRFQWQSIWRTLGDHFTMVGQHKNLNVVIYAIDSLRQLADKFLEKEERKNFSYQKMFLKPFETIMLNNLHSSQKEIKEYIVMCTAQLCFLKAKYIKSGWEVILNIFTLAAQDTENHLVVQSFKSLEHAVCNHFELLEEVFIELVNCLGKFSQNGDPQQTAKAVDLLILCARRLREKPEIVESYTAAQGQVIHTKHLESKLRMKPVYGIQNQHVAELQSNVTPANSGALSKDINDAANLERNQSQKFSDTEAVKLSVMQELWFPILRNFTGLIMEKNEAVRNNAIDAFCSTLQAHHQHFGDGLWREIFGLVLLPVFEDIRVQVELAMRKANREQAQHHISTLQLFLGRLNQFFAANLAELGPELLCCFTDAMCLFASNINNEELAKVVMYQLRQLVLEVGGHLSEPELWVDIIEQISLLYQQTVPQMLSEEMKRIQNNDAAVILDEDRQAAAQGDPKKKKSLTAQDLRQKFEKCYAKSATQLLLTKLVSDIVENFFKYLSTDQVRVLLQRLDAQFKFAKEFNSEINLRYQLWKQGYMSQLKHLPGLLSLEEESLRVYLSIRFKQHFGGSKQSINADDDDAVSKPLFALCSKVLKDYVLKHSELVSINTSKKAGQVPQASQDADKLSHLHEEELEKQLVHLGPIVHSVILENLMLLSDDELQQQSKELGQLLIDLTLCNDADVRRQNHKLLSRIFEQLQQGQGVRM